MQNEYILVLNTLSGDMSLIDPKDDSVVKAMPVGEALWVSSYSIRPALLLVSDVVN